MMDWQLIRASLISFRFWRAANTAFIQPTQRNVTCLLIPVRAKDVSVSVPIFESVPSSAYQLADAPRSDKQQFESQVVRKSSSSKVKTRPRATSKLKFRNCDWQWQSSTTTERRQKAAASESQDKTRQDKTRQDKMITRRIIVGRYLINEQPILSCS